ncbi:MAG: L-serine ammonia-lyase [Hyphomonadaceae bacterium]|nr:L-serine ammonia-lyase [Hyphomonadaceae bacterium]
MYIGVFDMFKIGVGPSSSHTMGPMLASGLFLDLLRDSEVSARSVKCYLRGSLAFTGRGHATDRAVALGLLGFRPDTVDINKADAALGELKATRMLQVPGLGSLKFCPGEDVVFDTEELEGGHPNQLRFEALGDTPDVLVGQTYFSIGGGFVHTRAELDRLSAGEAREDEVPFGFRNASELLAMVEDSQLSIAQIMRENEVALRSPKAVDADLAAIWAEMDACISRGLAEHGTLAGGLGLRRRAPDIYRRLQTSLANDKRLPFASNDWLTVYAMAVNEENAAGGRIVTAPTNGAAGVVPAVLRFFLSHCLEDEKTYAEEAELVREFLLTAGAIGGLIKRNASISGAEAGCQGEVGTASAMAAAGLCAVLGGTPWQIENAAEIALEHHLGMTCDPVAGLVQVPCIERNGFGAIKAVAAASLALHGDGTHFMPLDNCIEAMRQTGLEMNSKYRETALGGLAVNVPNC